MQWVFSKFKAIFFVIAIDTIYVIYGKLLPHHCTYAATSANSAPIPTTHLQALPPLGCHPSRPTGDPTPPASVSSYGDTAQPPPPLGYPLGPLDSAPLRSIFTVSLQSSDTSMCFYQQPWLITMSYSWALLGLSLGLELITVQYSDPRPIGPNRPSLHCTIQSLYIVWPMCYSCMYS